MDSRKEQIFHAVIDQYVKTSEPVGSQSMALLDQFRVSPATIRNEMAELEDMGYLTHPYTSAGRIPTEKGYQYYIEHFLSPDEPSKHVISHLKKAYQSAADTGIKNLARATADITSTAVFVAFADNHLYYTGLSNLFSHTEFSNHELIRSMGEIIDNMDNIVYRIFDDIDDIEVKIGRQNPFGDACASIIASYHKKSKKGLMGIIGTMRMDYQKNYSIIYCVKKLIDE